MIEGKGAARAAASSPAPDLFLKIKNQLTNTTPSLKVPCLR